MASTHHAIDYIEFTVRDLGAAALPPKRRRRTVASPLLGGEACREHRSRASLGVGAA